MKFTTMNQRITLKLTKREIVRLSVRDIYSFRPDPTKLQKIIIVGTKSDINAIRSLDYIKNLEKLVVKLDYDIVEDLSVIETALNDDNDSTQDTYVEDLMKAVENKPRQHKILMELMSG